MFINPKKAIENGWIKGNITDKYVQPNAIDFTLDRLFHISNNSCAISEEGKRMRGGAEIVAINGIRDMYDIQGVSPDVQVWNIDRGSYDCLSNLYVQIPTGVAAYLIVRSTFNRNGMFITSGLYDSGYQGHIGFAIHNMSGPATIAKGTRVGQIVFVAAENAYMYSGDWNHEEGTHYSEKK